MREMLVNKKEAFNLNRFNFLMTFVYFFTSLVLQKYNFYFSSKYVSVFLFIPSINNLVDLGFDFRLAMIASLGWVFGFASWIYLLYFLIMNRNIVNWQFFNKKSPLMRFMLLVVAIMMIMGVYYLDPSPSSGRMSKAFYNLMLGSDYGSIIYGLLVFGCVYHFLFFSYIYFFHLKYKKDFL